MVLESLIPGITDPLESLIPKFFWDRYHTLSGPAFVLVQILAYFGHIWLLLVAFSDLLIHPQIEKMQKPLNFGQN